MTFTPDWLEGLLPAVKSLDADTGSWPAGIRNANPGNIMAADTYVWRGQEGRDPAGHAIYRTAFWGIRAMAALLQGYIQHYNFTTIQQCITRYSGAAPSVRRSYGYYVAEACGIGPDEPCDLLNLSNPAIEAMIGFENACTIDGQKLTKFYLPEYIRNAIGAAHIR